MVHKIEEITYHLVRGVQSKGGTKRQESNIILKIIEPQRESRNMVPVKGAGVVFVKISLKSTF